MLEQLMKTLENRHVRAAGPKQDVAFSALHVQAEEDEGANAANRAEIIHTHA
jgi:hypothetical protein